MRFKVLIELVCVDELKTCFKPQECCRGSQKPQEDLQIGYREYFIVCESPRKLTVHAAQWQV